MWSCCWSFVSLSKFRGNRLSWWYGSRSTRAKSAYQRRFWTNGRKSWTSAIVINRYSSHLTAAITPYRIWHVEFRAAYSRFEHDRFTTRPPFFAPTLSLRRIQQRSRGWNFLKYRIGTLSTQASASSLIEITQCPRRPTQATQSTENDHIYRVVPKSVFGLDLEN